MNGLKKWEVALALAVALTLLSGTPGYAWWGAVYPELTPGAAARRVSAADVGDAVELRWRTLEWLDALRDALGRNR